MRTLKLTVLAFAAIAGATTVKAQTAEEIMNKHIEAIGGKGWDKINTMKLTGSLSAGGMDISITETVVNNKAFRMDFSVMGMNNYQIVTTKEGWMYMPVQQQTAPKQLTDEELKASQDQLNIKGGQMAYADKKKFTKIELAGKDSVNNAYCYKLNVTSDKGDQSSLFIDVNTYYVLRAEGKAKGPDGEEQTVAVNFSNFKKQDEGVVMPMTVGSPQGDITFTSVELNKPVDETIFSPAK